MRKAFKMLALALVLLFVAGLAAFLLGRETLTLDGKAVAALPGSTVRLSQGMVHYEVTGPEDGKPVLLVHGFSTPMFVWDDLAPYLAGKGFRVVRFDLYGRGLSERPDVSYGPEVYDREITDLITDLKLRLPLDVVGLSMGGAVSVNFCALHPNLVDRLVLIGPAGSPQKEPVLMSLVKTKVLGEALMGCLGGFVIRKGAAKALYDKSLVPGLAEKFAPQTRYKGYKRAILRTLRNFPLFGMEQAYLALGRQDRKVLLIWGEEDVIVPFENHSKVQAAVPGARFIPVPGAGHMPQYEKPAQINPIIADFLSEDTAAPAEPAPAADSSPGPDPS